jgi:hypothetical protein
MLQQCHWSHLQDRYNKQFKLTRTSNSHAQASKDLCKPHTPQASVTIPASKALGQEVQRHSIAPTKANLGSICSLMCRLQQTQIHQRLKAFDT